MTYEQSSDYNFDLIVSGITRSRTTTNFPEYTNNLEQIGIDESKVLTT